MKTEENMYLGLEGRKLAFKFRSYFGKKLKGSFCKCLHRPIHSSKKVPELGGILLHICV